MRTLIVAAMLALLFVAAAAQDAPADSLSGLKDGKGTLKPVARIAHSDLGECSGIQWWQGAWWAHNDSGDGPNLYRSEALDFKAAQKLEVPGAKAVDWEDITTYDGDLLACDIGDNGRKRDDLALYRVKHDKGKITLAATYPIAYPDGMHDAEAAFTIGGKLHIVIKRRGEEFTGVYRWNTLEEGKTNTGELVSKLDVGERALITAGDCDGTNVVLLSYARVVVYAADKLEGKPASSTRIHANQCEALCLHDGRLVFTNEQRDVFAIGDYLKRGVADALPPRVDVELPMEAAKYEPDGTGNAWKGGAFTLPLADAADGESVRWMISDAWLMVAGKLRYTGTFTSSNEQGSRLGTGAMLMFGQGDDDFLTGDERFLWLADNGITGLDAWSFDPKKGGLKPVESVKVKGEVKGNWMSFEYALPLTAVFGEGKLPDTFRANLWGLNLHGENEPHLAGANISLTARSPFTWAHGKIVKK
jgi:hypothetical protein